MLSGGGGGCGGGGGGGGGGWLGAGLSYPHLEKAFHVMWYFLMNVLEQNDVCVKYVHLWFKSTPWTLIKPACITWVLGYDYQV